jgi:hypothetical protein
MPAEAIRYEHPTDPRERARRDVRWPGWVNTGGRG